MHEALTGRRNLKFVFVLDSIEGHVIRAHDDVENANEQLHKASVYRVSFLMN